MSQLDIFGGEILMVDQMPAQPRAHDWKPERKWERCVACGLERSSGSQSFALVPCSGDVPIHLSAEMDYTFAPGDIWPDGDWPEQITTDAVLNRLRQATGGRGILGMLEDTGLDLEYRVQVDGDKSVRTSD